MPNRARLLVPIVPIVAAVLLAACGAEPGESPAAGEPGPDTFPLTGSGADLPEGMPLPPTDSLPPDAS